MLRLISKVIRISRAKFHCNVQDIQDYASLILGHIVFWSLVLLQCSLWFCFCLK